MRVTSKGQVTIPQEIRERAGFLPGTELAFTIDAEGTVRVERADAPSRPALAQALGRLRGSAERRLSTEEIMALTRG
jgi:AbrB family looped-hinge helix DNA binding protein